MRKLLPALAFVALLLTPRVSSADSIAVGDLLKFEGSLGSLGGGAFLIDNTSNGPGVDFMTFCVQMTQYIDYSQLFRVGSITNYADDAAGHDPLSTPTQWIFSSFRAGLLGDYTVDEIQAAIWKLEDEWTQTVGNSDLLISYAQSQSAGWLNDGVSVVNLFYQNGGQAQDQVIQLSVAALAPPPSGTPEPGTLAIMGIGGLILAARKRLRVRSERLA